MHIQPLPKPRITKLSTMSSTVDPSDTSKDIVVDAAVASTEEEVVMAPSVRGRSVMAGRWRFAFVGLAVVVVLVGSLLVQRQVYVTRENNAIRKALEDPNDSTLLDADAKKDAEWHDMDNGDNRRTTMVRSGGQAAAIFQNRAAQTCPRGWTAGRGSSAYNAAYNCGSYLTSLYGCYYGCGRSHDGAYYSKTYKTWLIRCYCGYAGKFDIYE
jgi:hypothetical protein